MKKKGLIISTVVMVVVLIASLTTATYAWFTTTASAAVDDLQIMTTASAGLQVAHYNPEASTTYSNGDGTLDVGKEFWSSTNSGFGSTVSFATDALSFYGVSGNGVKDKMFKIKTDGVQPQISDAGVANGATLMAIASVNEDYFVSYIALENTVEGKTKIVFDSISVTAQANNQGLTGMAKALRIAIFAVDTVSADTDFTADKLVMLCAPYAGTTYTANNNKWTAAGDGSDLKYLTGESAAADGRTAEAGTAKYSDMESESASSLTGKWIAGTGAAVDENNGPTTVTLNKAALSTIVIKDNCEITAERGVLTPVVVYLKLVVWFEGEDPGCLTKFAGGGAAIDINFTTEEIGD